jgi:uncharacterized protein
MLITEMSQKESRALLEGLGIGRLACASENQPYIVPIFFAYEENRLYALSTVGRKIEWMRANPLVCVQADEIRSAMEWTSAVVLGRYEELPDDEAHRKARAHAVTLLSQHSRWWQGAYASDRLRGRAGEPTPVVFCVHITEISGHRAVPEPAALAVPPPEPEG